MPTPPLQQQQHQQQSQNPANVQIPITGTVAPKEPWVSAKRAKGIVMQTMSVKGPWCAEDTIVPGMTSRIAAGNPRDMRGKTAQLMRIVLTAFLFAALTTSAGLLARVWVISGMVARWL